MEHDNDNKSIMKKTKIINNIKQEYPDLSKKDINKIVDIIFNTIVDGCENGQSYTQNNFGKFEPKVRARRKGRNIQTGEMIDIEPADVIKFTMSKTLFKRMNNIEK